MSRRIALALVLALPVLVAAPTLAAANAALCNRLEAELRRVLSAGSGGGRYDTAIARQQAEIRRAGRTAGRLGCSGRGLLGFRAEPHPSCGSIDNELNRMRANLRELERRRDRAARKTSAAGSRVRIEKAIARNGCRTTASRGGSVKRWQTPKSEGRSSARLVVRTRPGSSGRVIRPRGNTYRTMCVRLCDGYYWPISFSTTRSRFADDEAECQSSCPATETRLFTHRNPGEDAEQMVSLEGAPYTEMATAFRYRESFDPKCGCGATASPFEQLNDSADELPVAADSDDVIPGGGELRGEIAVPVARPQPGEDPDTLANRAGKFDPTAPNETTDGERKIRIVGPSYSYTR